MRPQDKLQASPSIDGFQPQPPYMWTKLRPGVRSFLQRASQLFELHVCTMGDRSYAEQMAALLDPHRTLFADRIISSVWYLAKWLLYVSAHLRGVFRCPWTNSPIMLQ